jgi:hypothetical protein
VTASMLLARAMRRGSRCWSTESTCSATLASWLLFSCVPPMHVESGRQSRLDHRAGLQFHIGVGREASSSNGQAEHPAPRRRSGPKLADEDDVRSSNASYSFYSISHAHAENRSRQAVGEPGRVTRPRTRRVTRETLMSTGHGVWQLPGKWQRLPSYVARQS